MIHRYALYNSISRKHFAPANSALAYCRLLTPRADGRIVEAGATAGICRFTTKGVTCKEGPRIINQDEHKGIFSNLPPPYMRAVAPTHFKSSVNIVLPGSDEMSTNDQFFPKAMPNFNDPKSSHGSKTIVELLRGLLVYHSCRFPFLVDKADAIISLSTRTFGAKITDYVMKCTFFKHFCAGEDEKSIKPVIDRLRQHGIGGILDYAAEGNNDSGSSSDKAGGGIVSHPPHNQPARVYDYKSEIQCDRHVDTFIKCIHGVRDVSPEGFAAIKVTALGNPQLLERMSDAITEVKKLYQKFDLDQDGIINREEFTECFR